KRIDMGHLRHGAPYAPRSRPRILFSGTSSRWVFARVAPRVEHAPPALPHEVLHVLRVVEPVLLVALEAVQVRRDLVFEALEFRQLELVVHPAEPDELVAAELRVGNLEIVAF